MGLLREDVDMEVYMLLPAEMVGKITIIVILMVMQTPSTSLQ